MTIIFKAKSQEAYVIKILAELLVNNIKTGCFEIDKNGISLRMMDHNRKILINLKLDSSESGFSLYKFNSETMFLGINLNHFYKMLRTIKKKDSIELYIDDDSITDLYIKVVPKENNKTTVSTVKIQTIQNLDIDIPSNYDRPISVPSSDFQKLIKELNNLNKIIKITAKHSFIQFGCDASGIFTKNVGFGEDDETEEILFDEDFSTEQLCKITKFAGLSNNIQIYPGHPLLFKSKVGNLGTIEVFIKSKQELETQFNDIDSDDSE
jgi:proliferating cell nuclear antigen